MYHNLNPPESPAQNDAEKLVGMMWEQESLPRIVDPVDVPGDAQRLQWGGLQQGQANDPTLASPESWKEAAFNPSSSCFSSARGCEMSADLPRKNC